MHCCGPDSKGIRSSGSGVDPIITVDGRLPRFYRRLLSSEVRRYNRQNGTCVRLMLSDSLPERRTVGRGFRIALDVLTVADRTVLQKLGNDCLTF